jgi:hypothetical protein
MLPSASRNPFADVEVVHAVAVVQLRDRLVDVGDRRADRIGGAPAREDAKQQDLRVGKVLLQFQHHRADAFRDLGRAVRPVLFVPIINITAFGLNPLPSPSFSR